MGYNVEDSLLWHDFQCENFISSDLIVSFICEGPADVKPKGNFILLKTPTHNLEFKRILKKTITKSFYGHFCT